MSFLLEQDVLQARLSLFVVVVVLNMRIENPDPTDDSNSSTTLEASSFCYNTRALVRHPRYQCLQRSCLTSRVSNPQFALPTWTESRLRVDFQSDAFGGRTRSRAPHGRSTSLWRSPRFTGKATTSFHERNRRRGGLCWRKSWRYC